MEVGAFIDRKMKHFDQRRLPIPLQAPSRAPRQSRERMTAAPRFRMATFPVYGSSGVARIRCHLDLLKRLARSEDERRPGTVGSRDLDWIRSSEIASRDGFSGPSLIAAPHPDGEV
jgi:hypothetical protein